MSYRRLLYYAIAIVLHFTFVSAIFNDGLNQLQLQLDLDQLDASTVKEKWIDQTLNHFDPHDKRTFKMRYWENLHYWRPYGPILILIGGEWNMRNPSHINEYWIGNSDDLLIAQMAKEMNGAMFATEHRYYGESLPNIRNDSKIEYYKYLSSRQGLKDIASLIRSWKSDPKFSASPVVVIGGSYPGNLAVWMRMLFPHLVDAAVASSAPVLAKKDFHEYLDIVRYAFSKYGPKNCIGNIENTFKRYEDLLKSTSGIEILKKELNICEDNDLTVVENQQCLFCRLYNKLKGAVQYYSTKGVNDVCNEFKPYNKLAPDRLLNNIFNVTCNKVNNCFDNSRMTKEKLAWRHQYCTEFGNFQTTSSEIPPFVHWVPLEFELKHCRNYVEGDIEKKVDEEIAKTNEMYGGKSPNVTKVMFTHGDIDPWYPLGIHRDLGPEAPVIMAPGTSHCAILWVRSYEPEEMKEIRKYVRGLIKKWIYS